MCVILTTKSLFRHRRKLRHCRFAKRRVVMGGGGLKYVVTRPVVVPSSVIAQVEAQGLGLRRLLVEITTFLLAYTA